ncbi:hypothetical protein L1987_08251 [Smallanthus sonchifolius]|uniref:Uncharacterized protein n=1 Tax=Smallanthus sonchifolius TaxID=185202 RepID=A0ACB9JJM2_9ASTR|nr:hypothetical protein L1987_08251 [Smallanthus sonchifolius]
MIKTRYYTNQNSNAIQPAMNPSPNLSRYVLWTRIDGYNFVTVVLDGRQASKGGMRIKKRLGGFVGSQREDGIYLHQTKYVQDILSKYKMNDSSTYGTPIPVNHGLHPDKDGKDVDCRLYRGMIGSLMYLTASRPDIMFAVCLCSRFQSQPKESHMIAVKRIFRYLNGKPRLGI